MDNLRLFVGIGLPDELIGQLGAIMSRMKADLPFRKWTHPDDLHITLHFLGDTTANRLNGVRAALAEAAAAASPFQLSLAEPGTFGPPHAPRILWLGVNDDTPLRQVEIDPERRGSRKLAGTGGLGELGELAGPSGIGELGESTGSSGLPRLHAALAPGLVATGFKLDERPFRAHLTLARQGGADCGEEAIRTAWQEAVAMSQDSESEPFAWVADRLTLFRSYLGRRPNYERMEEWRFEQS